VDAPACQHASVTTAEVAGRPQVVCVSPLRHHSDQSADQLSANFDSARHILQFVSHMQRLGRASVRTASSKTAVPACRVVGFSIPNTQCNR
jgi:hypothetical protein